MLRPNRYSSCPASRFIGGRDSWGLGKGRQKMGGSRGPEAGKLGRAPNSRRQGR